MARLIARGLALAMATGIGLSACSSGSGSAPANGGGGPVPLEAFAEEASKALCDQLAPCCQKSGFAHDPAACRGIMQQAATNFSNMVASGKAIYDPAGAGECVQSLAQIAVSCTFLPHLCDSVVQGTTPAGSPCEQSAQCAGAAEDNPSCKDFVCVVEPRGAAGSPCKWTCADQNSTANCTSIADVEAGARCYRTDGLYCDATTQQCASLIPVNGTGCSSDEMCVVQAYCAGDMCLARSQIGEACGECVEGSYCNASSVCAPKKGAGEPCDDWDSCATGFCEADVCPEDISSLVLGSYCDGA